MSQDDDGIERVPLWGSIGVVAVMLAASLYLLPDIVRSVGPFFNASQYFSVAGRIGGQALLMTFVLWAIFFAAVLRNKGGPGTGTMYYGILFAIVVVTDLSGLTYAKYCGFGPSVLRAPTEQEIAIGQAVAESDQAIGRALSSDILNTVVPTSTDAYGHHAQDVITAIRNLFVAARGEVKAVGYPDFMKMTHLARDPGFKKAHAGLDRMRALETEYNDRLAKLLAAHRRWLASLDVAPQVRTSMLYDFDAIVQNDAALRARLKIYDNKIYDECDAMLRDLKKSAARWIISGNTIVFAEKRDLTAFQFHQEVIQGYEEQAAAISPARLK